MRLRLVAVYVTLLLLACLGLAMPLAWSIASGNAADMAADRVDDAARFASLAGPALEEDETEALAAELAAYADLYAIHAAVVDRTGAVVVGSHPDVLATAPRAEERVAAALAGNRGGTDPAVWPWSDRPLVVVEPVARSGEVIGAVVTVSPTDALRRTTLLWWGVISAGVLLVLLLGTLAARPVVGWVLRPLPDLERATRSLGGERLPDGLDSASAPPELRGFVTAFEQMAGRVTALLRRRRNYTDYANHQVKNALSHVRLAVGELRDGLGDVEPRARDVVAEVEEEIDNIEYTCEWLHEIALGETHERAPVAADVRAIAERRVEEWRRVAKHEHATLLCRGAPHATVRIWSGLLENVMDILVDNAIKAHGVRIEVEVCAPADGHVDVHVRDDSALGLPEHVVDADGRPRDPDRDAPGSQRRGLTCARDLLEDYGGGLRLTRGAPRGTDARVRVPVVPDTAPLPGAAVAEPA